MGRYLAEFIGTFALIFIGAGSICSDAVSGGQVGIVGIALAHGLTIMVMVYAFGHISGGHFNPAVTAAMALTKRIEPAPAAGYVAAQLGGAALAGWVLRGLFPDLVADLPFLGACALSQLSPGWGIVVEALLTFFLVTVVWGMAVDPRSPKPPAGIAIGLTITLGILMGGALTGAAINPARAFGPALAAGFWQDHAVYWVGPLLGAISAALLYEGLFLPGKRRG
ncbi:MAG: MIP family channel protein [Candidatus Omnitrophica bacterium]|nr:MIP family channel protein [Candidatus Omnitrophota bacterium]